MTMSQKLIGEPSIYARLKYIRCLMTLMFSPELMIPVRINVL